MPKNFVLVCVEWDGDYLDEPTFYNESTPYGERDYLTETRKDATVYTEEEARAWQKRNLNPEPETIDFGAEFKACELDYMTYKFVEIHEDFLTGGEFIW